MKHANRIALSPCYDLGEYETYGIAPQDISELRFWEISNARDLEETTIYLHLSQQHLNATASPLDALPLASYRDTGGGTK